MQPRLKYVLLFISLISTKIDFDKSEAYGQNTMRAYETELAIKKTRLFSYLIKFMSHGAK